MVPADTPGVAVYSSVEDYVLFTTGIRAISGAILDAASEPFTQRIMELAISSAKRTDAPVATDMGLSRSGLKMEKTSGWRP
jgi:hypothetical protein